MKITQSIVAILLAGFLIQGSQQACLTTAQLNALGFTVSSNFTSSGNSSSVCTDLYSNGGNCVDPAQVQAVFNTNQANLQANAQATVNANVALNNVLTFVNSYVNLANNITAALNATLNATLSNLTNILGNLTANLTNTLNNTLNSNTTVSANATARTLQSANASASAGFNVTANDGKILQNIINNSNAAINPCYQAYQNLVNGLYCYLTSNQASGNTTVTSNGATTNFVVNVNTDATGNALNACLPVIDAYCLITYGVSISSTTTAFVGIGDESSSNSTGKVSLSTCQTLQNNYNCSTTACQTASKSALISNVFSANSVNFVQSKAYTDSITAMANMGLQGGSRRLQASSNNSSNIQTQPSSTGQDINKNGQNSGANTTTYKSSAKLFGAFFALLLTFLYA